LASLGIKILSPKNKITPAIINTIRTENILDTPLFSIKDTMGWKSIAINTEINNSMITSKNKVEK
jgi:hypothetical protein